MRDEYPITTSVQGYAIRPYGQVSRRAVAIQELARWKNDPEQVNGWLCKLIGGALQSFVMLGLKGQPAAEILPMTAALWVEVLADMNLTEDPDKERVATSIRLLTRKLKEWPQVADLIEVMPRRQSTETSTPAQRQRSAEEEQTAAEAMAEMRKKGII